MKSPLQMLVKEGNFFMILTFCLLIVSPKLSNLYKQTLHLTLKTFCHLPESQLFPIRTFNCSKDVVMVVVTSVGQVLVSLLMHDLVRSNCLEMP